MGKYYNIDPNTCTEEELQAAINNLNSISNSYNNIQMADKLFINGIYGCLANQYYSLNNTDIAESITLQGQNLIKYAVKVIDYFFKNEWTKSEELHKIIAEKMHKKYSDFNISLFLNLCKKPFLFKDTDTLQCAGDTDSAYLAFDSLIKNCNITIEQETFFLITLYESFLADYLNNCFEDYAKKFNCSKNIEEFALEKILKTGIFVAKKKYCGDLCWKEPNIYINPLHDIVYKGLEVVQGSTPAFCRDQMKKFIKFLLEKFNNRESVDYNCIISKLKEIKKIFSMQSPDEISKSFAIKDYDKFIFNDKSIPIIFNNNITCPMHIRAAANYNNMLYNSAKKWSGKYNFIETGNKIKFYYVKNDYQKYKNSTEMKDVFGFLPGMYPIEFAPPIDINITFEKLIMDPLNRIITSCGYSSIPSSFMYSSALF